MGTLGFIFANASFTPSLAFTFDAAPVAPVARRNTPNLAFSFAEANYTPSLSITFGTARTPPVERLYTPPCNYAFPSARAAPRRLPRRTTGLLWPVSGWDKEKNQTKHFPQRRSLDRASFTGT